MSPTPHVVRRATIQSALTVTATSALIAIHTVVFVTLVDAVCVTCLMTALFVALICARSAQSCTRAMTVAALGLFTLSLVLLLLIVMKSMVRVRINLMPLTGVVPSHIIMGSIPPPLVVRPCLLRVVLTFPHVRVEDVLHLTALMMNFIMVITTALFTIAKSVAWVLASALLYATPALMSISPP